VTLRPVHLVDVSSNVIWVTSQGFYGEYVLQFEMFAIIKYARHNAQKFWPRC